MKEQRSNFFSIDGFPGFVPMPKMYEYRATTRVMNDSQREVYTNDLLSGWFENNDGALFLYVNRLPKIEAEAYCSFKTSTEGSDYLIRNLVHASFVDRLEDILKEYTRQSDNAFNVLADFSPAKFLLIKATVSQSSYTFWKEILNDFVKQQIPRSDFVAMAISNRMEYLQEGYKKITGNSIPS